MTTKTSKFFAGFAMLIMILLTACSKDQTTPYTSIDDFFEKQQDLQTFTVNADNNISITGKQGTIVSIPAASIRDASGDLVSGNVALELVEVFTKSEMILNHRPTNINDGGMLVSAGEFFFKIKKGEEELSASDGVSFDFAIRDNVTNIENMSVWEGSSSNFEGNFPAWETDFLDSTNSLGSVDIDPEGLNFIMTVNNLAEISSLNWINCDYRFESTNPFTMIEAKPTGFDTNLSEVKAFIVFKSINSVLGMVFSSAEFESTRIPTGEEVTVLMIGIGDDKELYMGLEAVTVTENLELEVEMEKITEKDLKEKLSQLN